MVFYDYIVIGSGQGGNPFATAASSKGFQVAMIEKDRLGGTCVNYGCTPTKTLVASAKVAFQANRSNEFGINIERVTVDMSKVKERMNKKRGKWRSGSERSLDQAENVTVYRGTGSFKSQTEVKITNENEDETVISGRNIIINTGTRTRLPEIEGLSQIDYLTNKSILELEEVPKHLVIIGGGYIGLEFAQIYARFGSKVTVIHHSDQILSREDEDIANVLQNILEQENISFRLPEKPKSIIKTGEGFSLTVQSVDSSQMIDGTHLLLAAGRSPNSDMLNLDEIGVETDEHGFITINDQFQTSVDHIYAIGDVKGGLAFTHVSYDDYRILKEILLEGNKDRTIGTRLIPYTLFTDPQLGRVGISEKEAIEKGIEYKVAMYDAKNVARAFESDQMKGKWKILIDPISDQILGAAILGMEGGEIMSVIQLAMMGKVRCTEIRDGMFAHPTLAESLNNIFTYGFT